MSCEQPEIDRVIRRANKSDEWRSAVSVRGLLNGTALHAPGLSGNAVLICKTIRCVVNPSSATRAGKPLPAHWQAQVTQALDSCHQRAARYENGHCSSPSADSVVFSDIAQSLSCFVCDIALGKAGAQWWWKSLLRKYPLGADRFATIARVIGDNLLYLSQIVDYLSRWKMLSAVFGGLSDVACRDTIEHFLRFFQIETGTDRHRLDQLFDLLSKEHEVFRDTPTADDPVPIPVTAVARRSEYIASIRESARGDAPQTMRPDGVNGPVDAASLSWLGQADALFLLDALHRISGHDSYQMFFTSEWAHATGSAESLAGLTFAQRNLAGLARLSGSSLASVKSTRFRSLFALLTHPGVESAFPILRRAVYDGWLPFSRPVEPLKSGRIDCVGSVAVRQDSAREIVQQKSPVGTKKRIGSADAHSVETARAVEGSVSTEPPLAESYLATQSGQWLCTTDFGGVFYLINLLRFLGLPGIKISGSNDTSPVLSLWAWLELLARYLLAAEHAAGSDELWKVLALLDDRQPAERIDSSHSLTGEFIAPQRWREFLRRDQAPKVDRGERKIVASALEATIASRSLMRRLQGALPLIKQCLLRTTGDFAPVTLLRCRGRIDITRTHIDFYTSLDNISLIARRAGLDRDPGWCPEVGKVVLFHFE